MIRDYINPLSGKPFLEKSVFRLRKFAISGDWLNVNTK